MNRIEQKLEKKKYNVCTNGKIKQKKKIEFRQEIRKQSQKKDK